MKCQRNVYLLNKIKIKILFLLIEDNKKIEVIEINK